MDYFHSLYYKAFVTILLLLFMFWFFGRKACGIIAPWPGVESAPPALEGGVLTTGPPGKPKNCKSFFFFLNIYLFIWLLLVLVVACGIFSCGMWDLVPWPGIEPGPPALGAQSLSHWTTREVPRTANLKLLSAIILLVLVLLFWNYMLWNYTYILHIYTPIFYYRQ